MIARRCKLHRRDVVIVTLEGLHARIRLVEVPETNGHVGRARCEHATSWIECQILYDVGVAFQTTLKVARLVVPDFNGRVLRA